MRKKIIFSIIIILLFFVFLIFFKGLNKSSLYKPKSEIKDIPQFSSKTFFKKEIIDSRNIFDQNKYYLLNIWASWCLPCKEEHALIMSLANNDQLEIIGINYKDNLKNAKKFINELGNPYKKILLDKDGTLSIEWGAFGVPETFLIYENKIIKRFIGPLNINSVKEIEELLS